MKQRCGNPKTADYISYGGRGITVCERWRKFAAFIEDMGWPPPGKFTIDRINNDLGYCKENCRWATRDQQDSNKRNNVFIHAFGETLTRMQWAKRTGLPYSVIVYRIDVAGMSPEAALSAPKMAGIVREVQKIKNGEVVGVFKNLSAAALSEGLSKQCIFGAIKNKTKTSREHEWRYVES